MKKRATVLECPVPPDSFDPFTDLDAPLRPAPNAAGRLVKACRRHASAWSFVSQPVEKPSDQNNRFENLTPLKNSQVSMQAPHYLAPMFQLRVDKGARKLDVLKAFQFHLRLRKIPKVNPVTLDVIGVATSMAEIDAACLGERQLVIAYGTRLQQIFSIGGIKAERRDCPDCFLIAIRC